MPKTKTRRLTQEGRYKRLYAAYLKADRQALKAAHLMSSLGERMGVIDRKVGHAETAMWKADYLQSLAMQSGRKLEMERIRKEVVARSALLGGGDPFPMKDSMMRQRGWGFLYSEDYISAIPHHNGEFLGDGYIFGRGWFAGVRFLPIKGASFSSGMMWRELSATQKKYQHFRLGDSDDPGW